MVDEAYAAELESLLVIAEDIRDGRRPEPFTYKELVRLCEAIEHAMALLSDEDDN
jgi:hypothetical protein